MVIPLAQYNFKTTDKEITDYLDKADNVSKVIKEAIKTKQLHELNKIESKNETPIINTTVTRATIRK